MSSAEQVELRWLAAGDARSNYVHMWPCHYEDGMREGIIARLGVRNLGKVGIENVICKLEKITSSGNTALQNFKTTHLRWENSWGKRIENIPLGEVHKIENVENRLIHPEDQAFVDFGFVLPPGAPFYKQIDGVSLNGTVKSSEPRWCFHFASEYIPDHRNAIFATDSSQKFDLHLSIYWGKSESIHKVLGLEIGPRKMIRKIEFGERLIGNHSDALVKIRLK